MGGVKECNNLNGTLATHLSRDLLKIVNRTNQYWTGAVSPYTIQREPGDACLSVTRLGNQLVLEPDDCEAINSFICASDIMHTSDDKNLAYNTFTQTTNLNTSTANTHTSISSDLNVNIIIVVIIVASCVVMIAIVSTLSLVY